MTEPGAAGSHFDFATLPHASATGAGGAAGGFAAAEGGVALESSPAPSAADGSPPVASGDDDDEEQATRRAATKKKRATDMFTPGRLRTMWYGRFRGEITARARGSAAAGQRRLKVVKTRGRRA